MGFIHIYEQLSELQEENSTYYRIEVFDNQNTLQGGLFRGLNKLLKELWNADDELYDYINEPLSRLEYATPYPNNLENPKIKFAYKQEAWVNLIEDIKDIDVELNKIGWSLNVTKLARPINIIYEDNMQIAFIEN